MVYRVYVEKKPGQTHEADSLLKEIRDFLQIQGLESVRVLNRYDAENITEELFDYVLRVAGGEKSKNETYGYKEISIFFDFRYFKYSLPIASVPHAAQNDV